MKREVCILKLGLPLCSTVNKNRRAYGSWWHKNICDNKVLGSFIYIKQFTILKGKKKKRERERKKKKVMAQ